MVRIDILIKDTTPKHKLIFEPSTKSLYNNSEIV